jgi:hypothetical protein
MCLAIYQTKKNKVKRRKFEMLMTWNFVVKDSKFKKITMGLACGRIRKEGMHRDDYLCSIANIFWFYVGFEWALTLLAEVRILI